MPKIIGVCIAGVTISLANAALADNESDVRVASNRIQVTEPVDWTSGTAQGPTVVRVPGFGELFVAQCRINGDPPELGLRNTTNAPIDVLGVGNLTVSPVFAQDEDHVLQPGEEAALGSAIVTTPNNVLLITFQLGAGLGSSRRVATVTATAVGYVGSCRFQAQAIVHRL